jgi:diguanylate cyclase
VKTFLSYLTLVLLLFVVPSHSESDVDSLFALADKASISNPNQLQNLLQKIPQHQLTINQQQYYLLLEGYRQQVVGEHDKAIKLYQQGLVTGNSIDLKYRTLLMLSNIMAVKQNTTASFNYLFQATDLMDQVSDAELKPKAKVQAIASYMTLKMYQETKSISLELLNTNIQGNERCMALYYNNYSTQELAPKTVKLEQIKAGIDYCKSADKPLGELFGQTLIAKHYLFNKNFDKAEAVLQTNLKAAEDTGFVHLVGYYYVLLSQAQFSLGKFNVAETTIDKLLKIKNMSSSSEPIVHGLKLKAEIEEKLGNTDSALLFYKQYIEADTVYKNTLSLQQTSYHLAKNEILNKNQQIALLEKNNHLLTLENELSTVENSNKQLLIALLLILLTFLSYFAFRAFRNSRLYRKLAENDNLVGISNRYHFTKKVSATLASSQTTKQVDAFIIFDLDWFKQVNDQHGHLTGDWVLKAVVEHCRQFVRNIDIFGRIGGEEFAVFLPACTAEKAALLGEILRDAIEQIDCSASGHPINITASFGVTCTDRSGYELRQLFRDADVALYLSKNQGRNKVTLFDTHDQKESKAPAL